MNGDSLRIDAGKPSSAATPAAPAAWCDATAADALESAVAHLCACTYDGLHGPLCDERHEPFCLNQCSGHGLCDAHGGGFCHCDPGFFGVDCSMTTRAPDGHVQSGAYASSAKLPSELEP